MEVPHQLKTIKKTMKSIISDLNEIIDVLLVDGQDTTAMEDLLKNAKALDDVYLKQIQMRCKHNFVKDYIDIGCETSKQIMYCEYCELEK